MVIHTTAIVDYACDVDDEVAAKVINYAAENDLELAEAAITLYNAGELPNLYDAATEEDFSTEDVIDVELEGDEEGLYNELCNGENEEEDEEEEEDCEKLFFVVPKEEDEEEDDD